MYKWKRKKSKFITKEKEQITAQERTRVRKGTHNNQLLYAINTSTHLRVILEIYSKRLYNKMKSEFKSFLEILQF